MANKLEREWAEAIALAAKLCGVTHFDITPVVVKTIDGGETASQVIATSTWAVEIPLARDYRDRGYNLMDLAIHECAELHLQGAKEHADRVDETELFCDLCALIYRQGNNHV